MGRSVFCSVAGTLFNFVTGTWSVAVQLKRRSSFKNQSQGHRCRWLTCDAPWGNSSCWERDFLFPYSPAPPWGWLRYSSGVFMMMVSKSPIQYGCTPNTSAHTGKKGRLSVKKWSNSHWLCERETVRGCATVTGQCHCQWRWQWVGLAESLRAGAPLGCPGPFECDESVNAMQMTGMTLWPFRFLSVRILCHCMFVSLLYTLQCVLHYGVL